MCKFSLKKTQVMKWKWSSIKCWQSIYSRIWQKGFPLVKPAFWNEQIFWKDIIIVQCVDGQMQIELLIVWGLEDLLRRSVVLIYGLRRKIVVKLCVLHFFKGKKNWTQFYMTQFSIKKKPRWSNILLKDMWFRF